MWPFVWPFFGVGLFFKKVVLCSSGSLSIVICAATCHGTACCRSLSVSRPPRMKTRVNGDMMRHVNDRHRSDYPHEKCDSERPSTHKMTHVPVELDPTRPTYETANPQKSLSWVGYLDSATLVFMFPRSTNHSLQELLPR